MGEGLLLSNLADQPASNQSHDSQVPRVTLHASRGHMHPLTCTGPPTHLLLLTSCSAVVRRDREDRAIGLVRTLDTTDAMER